MVDGRCSMLVGWWVPSPLRGQEPDAGSGQLVGSVATGRTRSRCSGCTSSRCTSAGGRAAAVAGRPPRGRAAGQALG
eukprot:8612851-Alexandrium_andersonii.AAC.1